MVPIVIPTVSPQRDLLRERTINQLRQKSFRNVIISKTPSDVTPGFRGQGITARLGLIEALKQPCSAILHLEDDVILSDRLTPHFLEGLALHGGVVTLYLAGRQLFDVAYGSLVHKETWVMPVQNQTHWYGCQAVVIPRGIAEHLARIPQDSIRAIDFELRDYMDRFNVPLYAVVPNVVQHLAPRSVGDQAAGRHTSTSFI